MSLNVKKKNTILNKSYVKIIKEFQRETMSNYS